MPLPPPFVPRIRQYQAWLFATRGLRFDSFNALWRWSVTDLPAFWQSVWDFEGMRSPTPYESVLASDAMPGAVWFPGARVNYAERVLRHVDPATCAGMPAILAENESGERTRTEWQQLRRQIAAFALTLRDMGVEPGDRVAAYMPNVPETVVAFLGCASIGAIWSVCSPDTGTQAVLERFRQIEPTVLIAVDGVRYGGRTTDRSQVVLNLRAGLPSVRKLIVHATPYAESAAAVASTDATVAQVLARDGGALACFEPEWLPFDHPLWIVYSSGTTGPPKPIVHGHGGIVMTGLAGGLQSDLGASYEPNSWGERFHWFTSTGWILWNGQVGGLGRGTTICLYDGSPSGAKERPDWATLWRFAARHRVTYFGAGAAFYGNCMKAGLELADCGDLSTIRAIGSTGSPLPEDVQRWGSAQFERIGTHDIWWWNVSGGTDFAGAFTAGNRELPQVPGRMQCRQLGSAVEAWDEAGRAVIGAVGELVCTRPIPSMPLYFWGDLDNERYLSSYFDAYSGIWRHGDWLQVFADGTCVIYGRSDATINRHGVRLGSSEIYAAVEALPEVLDSMVVDLEYLGRPSRMLLFIVVRGGAALDDVLRGRIADAIRASLSPRFVPDEIIEAPEIPRTLSGKKQEVPIKKLLLGQPLERVLKREAMANPHCLDFYERVTNERRAGAEL